MSNYQCFLINTVTSSAGYRRGGIYCFLFVDVFISRHNANYGNNYNMLRILELAVARMISLRIEFVRILETENVPRY